jgi:hypothetical protein
MFSLRRVFFKEEKLRLTLIRSTIFLLNFVSFTYIFFIKKMYINNPLFYDFLVVGVIFQSIFYL